MKAEQTRIRRVGVLLIVVVALAACSDKPAQTPVVPPPRRIRPIRLAANERSTCFVNEDGSVYCWGRDCHGAPSYGWHLACPTPMPVPGIEGARELVLGDAGHYDCFRKQDDSVWCGKAQASQAASLPFKRVAVGPARAIVHADEFVCALLQTNKVACWAAATFPTSYPAPRPLLAQQVEPVEIVGLDNVRSIAAQFGRACAVTTDDKAYCWEGRADPSSPAVEVLRDGVRALVPGMRHDYLDLGLGQFPWQIHSPQWRSEGGLVCAITTNDVRCWRGGTSSPLPSGTLISLGDSGVARELALGLEHACALRMDGRVSCWGVNGIGQLGDGTQTSTQTPVQVKTDTTFTQLVAGTNHTCGLTADGAIECWGRNDSYELGTGRDAPPFSATPVNVTWWPVDE